MCFCAPGNVRELYSDCKSKIEWIYIFIFCHLDICTGLGSMQKGVPLTKSLADLSYCHKELDNRVWGSQMTVSEDSCGAFWRSVLSFGAGVGAAFVTRKPRGLFVGAQPSRSLLWVMLWSFWAGQELLSQRADQDVPLGFPVFPVAGV